MSAILSPTFLADLEKVYTTLRPPLSEAFLSDLEKVHATLPVLSDAHLLHLADRFNEWRTRTKDLVRGRLAKLEEDDPLKCPISLFRTMDYGRLETAHTRVLAWLLDPDKEHGFGTALLAALLRRVVGVPRSDGLGEVRLASEVMIGKSEAMGRLDVLAAGTWGSADHGGWVLVIEAKINAWESERQLDKYDEWIDSHAAGRETHRVFLTPDGREPESGCDEWTALSFLELVNAFRKVYGGLRQKPGFHFLRFYLAGVLQDVCHFPCNVGEDAPNPYAVASYLKTVHESRSEGASHDVAR